MENLRTGEKIAGAAGIALLLIMFIFDWFNVSADAGGFEVSAGGNAWEVFSFIDIVLFVAALAAIGLVLMSATQSQANMPVAMSALVAGLGILATVLVLYRIIDPPGLDNAEDFGVDIGRSIGVWLGLIASAGIAYGGWQAMQEEGTSFSAQRDNVGGGGNPPSSAPPSA
jgi:hypothetical protein